MNHFCIFLFVLTAQYWNNINSLVGKTPIESLVAVPAILLGVLVPLAIFMIDKKDSGFSWDKAVILTKVFNSRKLFWSLLLLSFSLVLWNVETLRSIFIILISWGLFNLIVAVKNAYSWLIVTEKRNSYAENYRTRKRIEYLKTLDDREKEIVWSLTWNEDRNTRSLIDERKLVEIFIGNLTSLLENKQAAGSIIQDFINNLDKINISDAVIHEHLVKFSLKWSRNLAIIDRENKTPSDILWTTRRLYSEILKNDIKDTYGFFLLLHDSRKYLKEENTNESVFVSQFSDLFLRELSKQEDTLDIWREFPDEWKITTNNLENKELEDVTLGWLNAYMNLITRENLLSDQDSFEFNHFAEELTSGLFPTIDPSMWADMVAFCWSSYGADENETSEHARVRSFIQRVTSFGLIGRSQVFTGKITQEELETRLVEQKNVDISETIKIATKTTAVPLFVYKSEIDKYLNEIKNFSEIKSGTKEYERLERLRYIFDLVKK